MTAPSSFNVSGLLSGVAGSIDTTSLVNQLMQVAALPQTSLKNQLSVQQAFASAYQAVSAKLATMQSAAQALTDPTTWTATTATSSSSAVVATTTGTAAAGSTTFDVLALAQAQVSTVAADASGNVMASAAAGIVITGTDNVAHTITPASTSATDVASAINAANLGVRASVVNTDTGQVLQMTAASTGTASAFTATGFSTAAQTAVTAADAKIGVGTVGSGGYTVSSSTNTFTGVISGVTFSVGALATGVTVSVASDEQSMSDKVSALVTAVNAASSSINTQTGQGAILEGDGDVLATRQALLSAVSAGANGQSLSTYGIDMDKNGVLSFDAKAFAAAYAKDPAGTQSAVGTVFAGALDTAATSAIDPVTGSITAAIGSATAQETTLNKQINDWTSRLADIQASLQAKYAAMQTALAKLSSQQTYLTGVFKSINGSSGSSSSG